MKTKLSMVIAGLLVSTHYRDFAMLREGRGEEGREEWGGERGEGSRQSHHASAFPGKVYQTSWWESQKQMWPQSCRTEG